MRKLIRFFCIFLMFIPAFATAQVEQSIETWSFTVPDRDVMPSSEQLAETARRTTFTMKYWNDWADDEGGAGGPRRFMKKWINPGVDFILGGLSPTAGPGWSPVRGLPGIRDALDNIIYEGAAQEYRQKRDAELREELERNATQVVTEFCRGNVECSETYFDSLINDSNFVRELERGDALGAYDAAQTRAYVKEALRKANENYTGVRVELNQIQNSMEANFLIARTEIRQGFEIVNTNQEIIIKNQARVIYNQQKHAIALQNMQNTLTANFETINNRFDTVVDLQQRNLFISGAILEGVEVVNKNVLQLTEKTWEIGAEVTQIRQTQLRVIFEESPIAVRIELLKDENSEIYKLFKDENERLELIANLESIKMRQDIANAAAISARWGAVASAAIEAFCHGCPAELQQGIQIGVTSANIVGGLASGNYAGAAMATIGLFGGGMQSPELKLLGQIRDQLGDLERNMNRQFQEVHEHLFAIEANIVLRLDIVDLKLDQILAEVLVSRVQLLEALSGIDASLSYIINQNECHENTVLTILTQGGQEMCQDPASAFYDRILDQRIRTFTDLDNFYRGGTCANCIEAIFDVSNVILQEAIAFRYSACQIEGADNKARPDRAYEFIYHNLLGDRRNDEVLITSLAIPPAAVTQISNVQDFIREERSDHLLRMVGEDANYRNVESVLTFADYVLTLFPLLELHDDGRLIRPSEINDNPGFSKERSRKLIRFLEDLRTLLTKAQIQQSMMTGHGMMDVIDQNLQSGVDSFVGDLESVYFSLSDLFTYNPYMRKNYSAYLLDRAVGFERLKRLVDSGQIFAAPQRISFQGYSLMVWASDEGDMLFSASLTNAEDPGRSVPLFTITLPVVDGEIGRAAYDDYLSFAIPTAMVDLERMNRRVTETLGEMYMITSNELAVEEAQEMSREDLAALANEIRRRRTM